MTEKVLKQKGLFYSETGGRVLTPFFDMCQARLREEELEEEPFHWENPDRLRREKLPILSGYRLGRC